MDKVAIEEGFGSGTAVISPRLWQAEFLSTDRNPLLLADAFLTSFALWIFALILTTSVRNPGRLIFLGVSEQRCLPE